MEPYHRGLIAQSGAKEQFDAGPLDSFRAAPVNWRAKAWAAREGLCITNLTRGSGFESGFSAAKYVITDFRSRQITRSAL